MADRSMIQKYREQATQLGDAIKGLTSEQLRAFPVPETWSIQQIVWHMVDSDVILADRMKRIIAEPNPLIMAFDETAFANNLFYQELDPTIGAKIFELNRIATSEILSRLPDDTFTRTGVHNEVGKVTLGDFLEKSVAHMSHHMKFLNEKRKIVGGYEI